MPDGELNIKQERALELVLLGRKDSEIAQVVGVTRQTINEWCNQNALFMATLRMRREMIKELHMDMINEMITESLRVMEDELHSEVRRERVDAAKFFLRRVGLRDYTKPVVEKGAEDNLMEVLEIALGEAAEEMQERYKGVGLDRLV